MSSLLKELDERGVAQETLVVWMGEFGRTPEVNSAKGRDHHSKAFSAVIAGGGTAGGRVIGKTDASGTEVAERPVTIPDLFVTLFQTLGIDPAHQFDTPGGRPIKLVDKGAAISELF